MKLKNKILKELESIESVAFSLSEEDGRAVKDIRERIVNIIERHKQKKARKKQKKTDETLKPTGHEWINHAYPKSTRCAILTGQINELNSQLAEIKTRLVEFKIDVLRQIESQSKCSE